MAATRKLFVNLDTKKLQVSETNGGIFVLPNFNKYENVAFKVVIVETDRSAVGPPGWSRVDIGNLSMSMALNDSYDDASPLAYQNTFTKNEEDNSFEGSLSLNTAALNSWLTSSDPSKSAFFEIEIQEGSNVVKLYVQTVTVQNAVAQVGAVVPSPVDEYYTKAQADQQFEKPVGEPGRQKTYTSPSNLYQRIIGVTDEGLPIDQIVPVV